MTLFLLLIHDSNGQTEISINLIKTDSIILDTNYITIIQRTCGWKSYGNYDYSKGTLDYDSIIDYFIFKKNGKLKVTLEKDIISFSSKYKIENNNICFLQKIKLRKGKAKWFCQKIIIATTDYLVLESINDNKRTRHIYSKR